MRSKLYFAMACVIVFLTTVAMIVTFVDVEQKTTLTECE